MVSTISQALSWSPVGRFRRRCSLVCSPTPNSGHTPDGAMVQARNEGRGRQPFQSRPRSQHVSALRQERLVTTQGRSVKAPCYSGYTQHQYVACTVHLNLLSTFGARLISAAIRATRSYESIRSLCSYVSVTTISSST